MKYITSTVDSRYYDMDGIRKMYNQTINITSLNFYCLGTVGIQIWYRYKQYFVITGIIITRVYCTILSNADFVLCQKSPLVGLIYRPGPEVLDKLSRSAEKVQKSISLQWIFRTVEVIIVVFCDIGGTRQPLEPILRIWGIVVILMARPVRATIQFVGQSVTIDQLFWSCVFLYFFEHSVCWFFCDSECPQTPF